MWSFLIRRLLQMVVVLAVLSFVIVALLRAMPGNPVDALKANPSIKPADIKRLEAYFGYNDPLEVYFAKQMRKYLINGDLGFSTKSKQPVSQVILPKVWNTLKLTVTAMALSLLIAIPLGVYSAEMQYSPFDYVVNFLAFVGVSFPSFFLAYLLIWVFSTSLGWFPPGGMSSDVNSGLIDHLRHLVLPTIALATLTIGSWTRYMRNSILEVNRLDFVRTAVAKGVAHEDILWKHVFRNSLIPLITLFALSMPALFSGALITETVFSWPGMGRLLYDSVRSHDYDVAIVAFMFLAFMTLLFNTLADVAYALADPRIRVG